jgi:hypothetical protein
MKIDQILPKSDGPNSIYINKPTNHALLVNNIDICQRSCLELISYLNRRNSSKTQKLFSDAHSYVDSANLSQEDYMPCIEVLMKNFGYSIGISLTRIEMWVESCLSPWISRPTISTYEPNRFEILLTRNIFY